jgi:lysophospholipase L1-like esterase
VTTGVLIVLAAVVAAVAVVVAVVVRGFARFRGLPANRPAVHHARPGRPVVVLLGASTIHGNVSFNIVDEVARRLPDHDLVNAGINGNTSAQALARVPEVIACRPDAVVVHIGANDALAMRGSPMARDVTERPTMETFAANLAAIVRALAPIGARIALMSIQPVGERPEAEINRDIDRINEVVRRTAAAEGVGYLPLHERLTELVAERGTGRPAVDSPAPVLRVIVAHLGLGVPLDRIGRRNGYAIHTDGLHLAGPGGLVAADLVEDFVGGSAADR